MPLKKQEPEKSKKQLMPSPAARYWIISIFAIVAIISIIYYVQNTKIVQLASKPGDCSINLNNPNVQKMSPEQQKRQAAKCFKDYSGSKKDNCGSDRYCSPLEADSGGYTKQTRHNCCTEPTLTSKFKAQREKECTSTQDPVECMGLFDMIGTNPPCQYSCCVEVIRVNNEDINEKKAMKRKLQEIYPIALFPKKDDAYWDKFLDEMGVVACDKNKDTVPQPKPNILDNPDRQPKY